MSQSVKTGTVTGTGAAIAVALGFVPDYVAVTNITDGTIAYEWWNTAANVTVQNTAGALSKVASNGISAYAGGLSVTPQQPGFTIGSAVSTSGKTLAYFALRSQDD
jgi:hypothetical protein